MKKNILTIVLGFFCALTAMAQVTITKSGGWLESAYVEWAPFLDAESYHVYYSGGGVTDQKIDHALIRNYGSYFRADVLGLVSGSYSLKIVPVASGIENTASAATTNSLVVKPHLREGFAFLDHVIPGAYNADGTPKSGAKIIYISSGTVNTISCDVVTDSKGTSVKTIGLMNILTARGKGYDKTPLVIRMIGTIKAEQVVGLKDGNYISFTGFNNTTRLIENITFEGVGEDATANGYGFYTKRSKGIEIRNIGIMLFGDDGVSMETDNFHCWIHHCDFFYGKPGADADQIKGDGSIDMKYNSTNITLSYNHFWDSGKVMGCGGATGETSNLSISFHHNWFDHTDSRCPRLTNTNAHIYNNYFDGVAKYSVGTAYNVSAFVESNYFRSCSRVMTISGQGTDTYNSATGLYDLEGTFSGQNGGMTKSFNNTMVNCVKFVDQNTHPTQFDAYTVTARNAQIPSTVKSIKGEYSYSNFDTDATFYVSNPDAPDDARTNVLAYAGRMNGGDFKWTFNNAVDDASSDLNTSLKSKILNYQSTLLSIQGETALGRTVLKQMDFDVFPNPVVDRFTIQTDASIFGVELYNLCGALVYQKNGDVKECKVENLTKGLYLVKVVSSKGIGYKKIAK